MPDPIASLALVVLPELLAVSRLPPSSTIPNWASGGRFTAMVRTPEELSIVCDAARVPPDVRSEGPFRALQVLGPLDFRLTGVLAALAVPLAEEGVPVFAISTFDTDYLLVRHDDQRRAIAALERAGHRVARG